MTLKKAFTETDFMEKYIAYFSNDTKGKASKLIFRSTLCKKITNNI